MGGGVDAEPHLDGSGWVPLEDTVVAFDPPLHLLRGPLPAGRDDNPSEGSFVLAFRDDQSWRWALCSTQAILTHQCEAGARVGCSISASNKCKLPWWTSFFQVYGSKPIDFEERERCEDREMEACLASAKEACVQFAKAKYHPAFQDARIAYMLHASEGLKCTTYKGASIWASE